MSIYFELTVYNEKAFLCTERETESLENTHVSQMHANLNANNKTTRIYYVEKLQIMTAQHNNNNHSMGEKPIKPLTPVLLVSLRQL